MLAILYLLLCAAFGMCFVGMTVPDVRRLYVACSPSAKAIAHIPNTLFTVPAGIVTGMLCVPFFNYYVTLGLSYLIDNGSLCKKLGVLITFAFFIWMILTCLILINRKRVKRDELAAQGSTTIEEYRHNIPDALFYGIIIVAITATSTFLMFYTYRINGSSLLNGASTFSDLSPHTAMVSSFGKGFNFPTQYMHFSGDGIKYHFLFYFLAGTLQYLGLPIDYALNLPSIMSMVSALILLGLLAVLISSRRAAFFVAPVLVFFRSSLNVFFQIKELLGEGNSYAQTINNISNSSVWYKVTDYDNWGIWAINVYPNQRHLMLGVAVIILMVIIFLPFVRRLGISISRAEGFGEGVKTFFASKTAWLTRSGDPLYPVSITLLACVLVIVMPYFHGSCLIALLLVLFGMAIFSESRLLYLAVAVCAVVSSYVQTLVFSGGYKNVVSFAFEPGFILGKEATAGQFARYLIIITGLTLVLAFIYAVITLVVDIVRKKPVHRFLLFLCVLIPLIFAFVFKVSLEMLANHKFIQVTLILVDAFVAAFISNLLFIPFKIRKKEDDEAVFEEDDTIDANSIDGETAVAVAADTGVRTPTLSSDSAFGDIIEDDDKTDAPDLEALETHTGVDADISGLNGISSESSAKEEDKSDKFVFGDEDTDKKEESDEDNGIFEIITDEDGDEESESDNKEEGSSEDDESSKEEAKAGVAALAALFGEDVEKKEESSDKPEESEEESEEKKEESESSEKTEEKPDEDSEEEKSEDKDGSDEESAESEEGIKESTEEPAHIAMRPGSIALSVQFGEEEPEDSEVEVVSESESEDEEDDEEFDEEELKHEPIKPKKKGIPFAARIALELAGVILAVFLMVPLTATGLGEWATYININKSPVVVNTNSPLTKWVLENTDEDDVFLTPYWSMNRFILAGRPMYYGWPYYAWSAGHDTDTRGVIYLWLISGCNGDINEFTRYCKERHIKYLIADPEFDQTEFDNGVTFNREFFEKNLTQVAYFSEENTTIYKIY